MELIGDQREHSLTLHLGVIASSSVVLAQLFQLVVQVSHSVGLLSISIWWVFLITCWS